MSGKRKFPHASVRDLLAEWHEIVKASGFTKDLQRFPIVSKQLAGWCFFCHVLWRVLEGQKSMFPNSSERVLGTVSFLADCVFLPADLLVSQDF